MSANNKNRHRPLSRALWLALGASLAGGAAAADAPAQTPPPGPQAKDLAPVQVSAIRMDIPPFDIPASISDVELDPSHGGKPGVNLSEALVGVPGVLVRDRQNYAQDAQLTLRGFGARSTFGVRGVRVYTDGIPGTLPDGQGQISQINLATAERIEVLRGPFSALYGNSSGGVVEVTTAEGGDTPVTRIGVYGGSYGTFSTHLGTSGKLGGVSYNVGVSHFQTDGYRDHSRAMRDSLNAKFGIPVGESGKLTLVLNSMALPHAQDPLGLTAAQYKADRRQAPLATQYDTRKAAHQTQLGAVYEQSLGTSDDLRFTAYGGRRSIIQYLSIPQAPQRNPKHAGGVVYPVTDYEGLDARWTHRGELAGRPYEWVLGASYDNQDQRRKGYENFIGSELGVRGRLRRNEDDNVYNLDQYAQWYWHLADRWTMLLGARHDAVRFKERDHYITAGNPDDSGHVSYGATTPVAGLQFRATDALRFHASYGKGFETPTYNELGYRADGEPGLAFNLRPARSQNYELGAKWQPSSAVELDAAVFRTNTRGELAVYATLDGRATYQNLGNTRRQGYELSFTGDLGGDTRLIAAYTHLQATFRQGYASSGQPVRAGNDLPGVPGSYGSLRLEHGGRFGWQQGLELSGAGKTPVNDANTAYAAGYLLTGVDAAYVFNLAPATLRLSARVDNLLDRRYVGSVIVNDGNGRYFEPGPGRSVMLGAELTF
ncbi:TonB-dependent receptor family protein [Frateuria defendens]|uniref:TonB-dependent receptor family protein n=1 Tax=Frateuria defendens TaxID=2219559 RepID=UPI0009E63A51|nr:TonB-dependent receptor [Frateuria defendens]